MTLQVLYEDNHLIAVYKPAGVLVQADDTKDPTLMDEVKYYLKQKYHKTGQVFLGLVHRLDRPVSGIILFAKTSKGASRLSEQFRNHTVQKIYHALVIGKPNQPKGTLVHWLKKDENKNRVTLYDNEVPGSLRAELRYKVVSVIPSEGAAVVEESLSDSKSSKPGSKIKSKGFLHSALAESQARSGRNDSIERSVLEIELKTGRSHQIRSQLAALGCPIVGDVKYGAPQALPDRSLALCAVRLTFKLPTKEVWQTVEILSPF